MLHELLLAAYRREKTKQKHLTVVPWMTKGSTPPLVYLAYNPLFDSLFFYSPKKFVANRKACLRFRFRPYRLGLDGG